MATVIHRNYNAYGEKKINCIASIFGLFIYFAWYCMYMKKKKKARKKKAAWNLQEKSCLVRDMLIMVNIHWFFLP